VSALCVGACGYRSGMPEQPATDPTQRLRTLLCDEPPASVLGLPVAARSALADLLEDSRRRQFESLEQAFTATLKYVPFPVRGIVKKVLLG
jgi:hypothetical protein